jgi:hypothetical protein
MKEGSMFKQRLSPIVAIAGLTFGAIAGEFLFAPDAFAASAPLGFCHAAASGSSCQCSLEQSEIALNFEEAANLSLVLYLASRDDRYPLLLAEMMRQCAPLSSLASGH